mgnify:CR=1 FL=1
MVKSPADFPLIVVLLEGQSVPGLPFVRRLHFVISADPASTGSPPSSDSVTGTPAGSCALSAA